MLSDEELYAVYGRGAVLSRKHRFVLVHLDHPSEETVRQRTAEFEPDEYFDHGCPICQTQRAGGVVVFDDGVYEEEISLE